MKKGAVFCFAMLACCLCSHGQLLLNPGDTWAYKFDSLPKTGSISMFVTNPVGSVAFTVDASSFQKGDELRYEMFENSLSEQPICSGLITSVPPSTATCQAAASWQDLQGVIRLTMISGSMSVTGITLLVIRPGPSLSSYDVYSSTFVPVPDPSRVLAAAIRGGKMIVSWPQGGAYDFYLQAATNLSAATQWVNVTNPVYALGTNYYTTNQISASSQFFRLHSRP